MAKSIFKPVQDTRSSRAYLHLSRILHHSVSFPLMFREALLEQEYRRAPLSKKPTLPPGSTMARRLRSAAPRPNRAIASGIQDILDSWYVLGYLRNPQGRTVPDHVDEWKEDILAAYYSHRVQEVQRIQRRFRALAMAELERLSAANVAYEAHLHSNFVGGEFILPASIYGDRRAMLAGHVSRSEFDDPVIQAKAIYYAELFFSFDRFRTLYRRGDHSPETVLKLLGLIAEVRVLTSFYLVEETAPLFATQQRLFRKHSILIEIDSVVRLLNSNGYFLLPGSSDPSQIFLTSRDGEGMSSIGTCSSTGYRLTIPVENLLQSYPSQTFRPGTLLHQLEGLAHRLLQRTRFSRNRSACDAATYQRLLRQPARVLSLLLVHRPGETAFSWEMQPPGEGDPSLFRMVERPKSALLIENI